jgi:hypothetical protein
VIDPDKLPPTQYLIGEVLAARHRLGEPFWHFPTMLGRAIDALVDAGLVESEFRGDIRMHRIRFTEVGRKAWVSDTYKAPAGDTVIDLSVTSCPKCGHADAHTRHIRSGDHCSYGCRCGRSGSVEGFVRSCMGCDYVWFTDEVLSS